MATRNEINNAILEACQAILPSVKWTIRLLGAEKDNGACGSISCDRIELNNITKNSTHALAKYEIYVIDFPGTFDVELAGDIIASCFNMTNMGGLCYQSQAKSIIYGSAQGYAEANACLVNIEVEFEYEIEKGV